MLFRRREAIGLLLATTVQAQERTVASASSSASVPTPARIFETGSTGSPPRQIALRAGPLHLLFEPDLAQIRHIRLGETEVLRAVYGAVRNRNWDTVLPTVRDLRITTSDEGFSVRFTAECRNGEVHFVWDAELDGDASGQIRYHFRGQALNTFLRNRIGFCVLHDGDRLPGQPVRVEMVDGSIAEGMLPLHISPHQPFFNIRAITHTVQPGLQAEVRMEGDIFEMEDQRNWTDASFKTYSTPLALPFPVEVPQGATIDQTVTLRLIGTRPEITERAPSPVTVRISPSPFWPLPPAGACLAADAPSLTAQEAERLRHAGIAHLRVDLHLFESSWKPLLARSMGESRLLGVPLELALHLSNEAARELAALAAELTQAPPPVARILVFHRDEKSTTRQWLQLARQTLRPLLPQVPIGTGSNAYFTEVNRGRPPLDVSDFVTWSTNPQVHAFDNLSLAETLPMHASVLASARAFCGNLPLVVSPISFKPRFNPNATGGAAAAPAGNLPDSVDPRQLSLFGAGWTLGVRKYLAVGGAAAVTLYETTGWRGWMETPTGSPLPARFPSQPGAVFPLCHVLADYADFRGGEIVSCTSSAPLAVEAVALRRGNHQRILLANLTGTPQTVVLAAAETGVRLHAKTLDADTVLEAMRQPEAWRAKPGAPREAEDGRHLLALLPYAVVRLDREDG